MSLEWEVFERIERQGFFRMAPLVYILCVVLTPILVVTIKIHCHYTAIDPGNGPKNLDSIMLNTILAVLGAFGMVVGYYVTG